jgi:tetratricopeptide (TPR) repeat protein
VRADASNLEDRLTLALAHMKLGEVLATSGNRSEAMKHYDEAFHINDATKDSGTPDWPALREEAQLWADLGSAHAFLSDPAGALDCYGRALQTTERFPAAHPQTKAHDLAFDQERVAYYTALTGGDAAGAEATIGESIETYKVMAAKTPTADRRRDLAQAYETLAEVQQLAGESAEALASIRLSLPLTEALLAEDPKDEPTRIDRQQGLMEEIELLAANDRTEETRAETRSALEFMKPLAEQSDQFQHAEDYAQLLATTHFDELRDDKAALKYGRKAVMMTHGADPEVLHVLALAYERNGDKQLAIDADRKALKLLPAGPSVFRTTLDAEISRLSQ